MIGDTPGGRGGNGIDDIRNSLCFLLSNEIVARLPPSFNATRSVTMSASDDRRPAGMLDNEIGESCTPLAT